MKNFSAFMIKTFCLSFCLFFLLGCQPQISQTATAELEISTAPPAPQPSKPSLTSTVIATVSAETEEVFTKENPLRDNAQIIPYLQDLSERFLAQFSQAGWYYFPQDGRDTYWVHIPSDYTGSFDQFLTTRQNYRSYPAGFIFPAFILLPDGTWGDLRNDPGLSTYQVINGGYEPFQPLLLENLGKYGLSKEGSFGNTALESYLKLLRNPNEGDVEQEERSFSFWSSTYEGREVYILLTRTIYPGSMKPLECNSGRPISEDSTYTYFDKENGGRIAEEYTWIYEDGESNNKEDWLIFNQHLVEYFTELPPDIQTLFDQTAQDVRDYLANNP